MSVFPLVSECIIARSSISTTLAYCVAVWVQRSRNFSHSWGLKIFFKENWKCNIYGTLSGSKMGCRIRCNPTNTIMPHCYFWCEWLMIGNVESLGRGKFFILIWEKLYISVTHLFLANVHHVFSNFIIIIYNLYVWASGCVWAQGIR